MYKIIIKYHYYIGTVNCPQDTNLGTEFETVVKAEEFLAAYGITQKIQPKVYCVEGPYMLNHGEYARPTYTIVKQGV